MNGLVCPNQASRTFIRDHGIDRLAWNDERLKCSSVGHRSSCHRPDTHSISIHNFLHSNRLHLAPDECGVLRVPQKDWITSTFALFVLYSLLWQKDGKFSKKVPSLAPYDKGCRFRKKFAKEITWTSLLEYLSSLYSLNSSCSSRFSARASSD